MSELKLQANRRDISGEQRSFMDVEFEITESDPIDTLEGKDVAFLMQSSEFNRTNLFLATAPANISVNGMVATVRLTPEQTDWVGDRWYELWVDWGQGQLQKQFKGNFTLTPSGSLGENN